MKPRQLTLDEPRSAEGLRVVDTRVFENGVQVYPDPRPCRCPSCVAKRTKGGGRV